ncbi:MAG: phosphoribosylglycinamide formyltransferase [Candidatus Omnitrophica bacterium]|nr:phosphoribosylglycinamide formyltransferase [Candidatus Omnitrophota bacterium]
MKNKGLLNIAIFCSGKGTNLQAIIDKVRGGYIKANLRLVISDRRDAYALVRAKKAKINNFFIDPKKFSSRIEFNREILKYLKRYNIDLIVLAGFMRVLGTELVRRYKNKILNIHPALLPSFRGTEGIKDALEYGVRLTGPTVHFVDEGVDTGPIILQDVVRIKDGDTEETLARRIHEREHIIYPKAIKLFVEGKLKVEGRKVKIRDKNK